MFLSYYLCSTTEKKLNISNSLIKHFLIDPNYEPADKPTKKLKSDTKVMVS